MRILVTGGTGFAGGWLCEILLARGQSSVLALSRSGAWPKEWQHLQNKIALSACDLTNTQQLLAVLSDFAPTHIYHLAGYANVARSFKEIDAAWAGNLFATRTLYDAVVTSGLKPRILAVSSGMIYGDTWTMQDRLDESSPLRPNSPYAASKAAADLVSYQYTRSHDLDIVRARPFNHIGPRQSAQFASASFARQLAEIAAGTRPPLLETGNLSSTRDLTDVRDVADAYIQLMDRGRTGEAYHVASGQVASMQRILDQLIALSGLQVEVRQRADLMRAADATRVVASRDKIEREIGWKPERSLADTLRDILAYWKQQI